MKTKLLIALFVVCLTSCTAPTQKIAVIAMQRGLNSTETIISDLANEAKTAAEAIEK